MFKNLLKVNALASLLVIGLMTACTDEGLDSSIVENYVIESTYEIQKNHMVGRPGCFELVFPVTLSFPDSTTADVTSYEELKEAIRNWREANPDVEGRPTLEFPVDVLSQDGELITIADKSELRELVSECRQDFRHGPRDHHRHNRFRACFDLVFPINILLPNGNSVAIQDYGELKLALRTWRQNNPTSTDRPVIEFPIQISYDDGSVVDINSVEELKEAKRDCRD